MFDFQKEVVLNSLDNVKKVGNGFRVDGMIYKNDYVGNIYKTEAIDGKKATLTIDLDKLVEATKDVYLTQFVLEFGLDRDYRGDFGSVLFYFRKPVVVNLTADKLADVDTVVKAFTMTSWPGEKLYSVSKDGNKVVLTAADEYIIVRKAELVGYMCDSTCSGESMEVGTSIDVMGNDGSAFAYTENVVGFGTYEYMIHNLRLPTHANIRFMSQAEVEMPIKGGKYTQYSFEYTVPRRIGGLSVAGQNNYSTTIHTFFVLDTIVSDFEKTTGIKVNGPAVNAGNVANHESHVDLANDIIVSVEDTNTDGE